MKKIQIILLFIMIGLGKSNQLFAQATNYTLQTDQSGSPLEYIARDYISLLPGFSYKPSGDNTFHAQIDPTLLFPPTDNTFDPVSGGMIGSIPGEFGINPMGAATYNLPIDCPEGINNMQPNISLVYNSNGGNGYLGWGWSLSAFSAVTRAGSTLHHDGKISEIKLDSTDNYVLDGQRLFLISSTPGSFNKEFKTEIENYSQIKTKATSHLYFEVITKEGMKLEYGSTDDSRMDAVGQNRIISWLLKKVTDLNGNYIQYNYEKRPEEGTGEVRLSSIQYTGNAFTQKTPSYTVEFQYDERSDKQYLYIGGSRTCISKTLSKISIKKGDKIIRWYDLRYDTNPLNTKLISVQVCNGAHEKMNATSIEWGATGNAITEEAFQPTELYRQEKQPFWYADFNADGRMDFVTFVPGSSKLVFYLSDNSTDKQFVKWREIPFEFNNNINSSDYKAFHTILTGDFDADGLTDFVLVTHKRNFAVAGGNANEKYVYKHELYLNKTMQPYPSFIAGGYIEEPTVGLPGDFDGDKKLELVFEKSSNTYRLSDYNAKNLIYGSKIAWGEKTHTTDLPNNKYMLDFNGDGKTDIMVLDQTGYRIYTMVKNGYNNEYQELFKGHYPTYNTGIYFADFNGDGKTDLISQKVSYDETYNETDIHLSTGKEFCVERVSEMQKDVTRLYLGDYNGDHRADVAYFPSQRQLKIGIFTGLGFNWNDFNIAKGVDPMNNDISADFNGDGKDEIIYNAFCNTEGNTIYTYSLGKNGEDLYVSKIKDGMGKTISIDYDYTYNPSVYFATKLYLKNYPLIGLTDKLKVVKSYSISDGDNLFKTEMKYLNGRIHLNGKGFLGFENVISKDITSDIQTTTTYGYDTQFYSVFMEKQESMTTRGNLISSSVFTNKMEGFGKRYFPFIEEETKTDHLTGLVTTTYNYSYIEGNPGKIITRTGDFRQETAFEYAKIGSPYQNKIKKIIVDKYLNDNVNTQRTSYEYDDNGNLLKEILNEDMPTEKVTIEYSKIDPYGRYGTKSIRANNGKGVFVTRSIQRTFTANGDFMASLSNVLGEVTTYDWDESTGLLKSETNPQGLITNYQYDNWGKLKETRYPDGRRSTEVRQWAEAGNEFNAKYYTYAEISGSSPVWTWYDALGRVKVSQSYGLNDKLVSVFTQYDSKGKVWRISDPTFNNIPDTWAETRTYDQFGRPSTTTTLMGKITTTYNGLSTTVASPTSIQTTILNSSGMTQSVMTNDKLVAYVYYASGLVKTATPQDGKALTMQYNRQGDRTRLTDPDGGTIRSEYNGFGELIATVQKVHADQDSIRAEHYYNDSGLITKVDRNGEITNYTYDPEIKNRLKSITISGKHNQTFEYDRLGKIISATDNVQQKAFKKAIEYDSFGRIKKEIYPSGYYILNKNDKYGNLIGVTDRYNRNIWQAIDENAKGQILHENKGGKITACEYDQRGFPETISADGIMDMFYSFNSKGNLEYRMDRLTNQKEIFKYDNMNRLTNWDLFKNYVLVKQNNMLYNDVGNIAFKSDLDSLYMNYGEDGKGPHVLTSINGVPKRFPTEDLNVTYTDFKKINTLAEGNKLYTVSYGVDEQRCKTVYLKNNIPQQTRYYLGNYEQEIDHISNTVKKVHYLPGNSVLIIDNEDNETLYYGYVDYQGSLMALANSTGIIRNGKFAYDPWGKRRNPENWSEDDNRTTWTVNRGYTRHEHLDEFGIINMNGRVYDPFTASFFSPDPYVQAPDNWMNFNRYAYCLNNPFIYTDPTGESPLLVPIIIGAVIGAYTGGVIANDGQYNPVEWDYSSDRTWRYMFGGAVVGGVSGYAGALIAGSGIPMANSVAIAGASFSNSLGTWAYTGGQTPITMSFGAASYDFTNGTFGYLGKKGNKWYEDWGYGFGALANLQDLTSLFRGGGQNIVVNSASTKGEHEWWGHSSITDENGKRLVSIGPIDGVDKSTSLLDTWKSSIQDAKKNYDTYFNKKGTWSVKLNNVSTKAINNYVSGITRWDLLLNSCVGHTSRALWAAGIPNIYLFHPHFLNAQLFIRQLGIYSSPYLYQIP